MPNKVKLVHPHSKFVVTFNLSFENFFHPIQITLVFSLFVFKPDQFPYISRVFRADCKECWLPFSISVVSSANCVSLNLLFFIFRPTISGLSWISLARISAPIRNRYAQIRSPWRQPLLIFIGFDKKPHFMTYAVISVLKSIIHLIKFLLYPKSSRTLYKNFHESESNAFSKSIIKLNY